MCVIITENYIKFVCLMCVGVGKINQHIYVDSNECCQYHNPAAESLIERRRVFIVGKLKQCYNETSWQPFILNSDYLPNHCTRRLCA